jgi:hypothetical protein
LYLPRCISSSSYLFHQAVPCARYHTISTPVYYATLEFTQQQNTDRLHEDHGNRDDFRPLWPRFSLKLNIGIVATSVKSESYGRDFSVSVSRHWKQCWFCSKRTAGPATSSNKPPEDGDILRTPTGPPIFAAPSKSQINAPTSRSFLLRRRWWNSCIFSRLSLFR